MTGRRRQRPAPPLAPGPHRGPRCGAVAIAVAVTTLGIYLTVRAQLYDQLDSDLLARAQAVIEAAPNPEQIVVLPDDALGDARIAAVTSDRRADRTKGGELPPLGDAECRGRSGRARRSRCER